MTHIDYMYTHAYIHTEKVKDRVTSLYHCVHDGGSLLPKYADCTIPNIFDIYLIRCGSILLLIVIFCAPCRHTYILNGLQFAVSFIQD